MQLKLACICIATFVLILSARASAAQPRFGYVMPQAELALMQPALDRYADNLRQRLFASDPLEFVSLKGGKDAENPVNCRQYGLAGFFQPNRRWRITDGSINVHVDLTVIGCDGVIFYRGDAERQFERDTTEEPQQQIDTATSEATAALVANFEAFQRGHAADWNKIISNRQVSSGPTR